MKEETVLNEAQERSINEVRKRARRHQEKREYFKSEPRSGHIAGNADESSLKAKETTGKPSQPKHSKKDSVSLKEGLDKTKTAVASFLAGLKTKKAKTERPHKENTVKEKKIRKSETVKENENITKAKEEKR